LELAPDAAVEARPSEPDQQVVVAARRRRPGFRPCFVVVSAVALDHQRGATVEDLNLDAVASVHDHAAIDQTVRCQRSDQQGVGAR
jgi:hypothetical protein